MIFIKAGLFAALVSACAICLFLHFRHARSLRRMRGQVDLLVERLEKLEHRGEETRGGPADEVLLKKRLSERFQDMPERQVDVSSKYRHVLRLERSGLGADEIAEILEVSRAEAEQMLMLARSAGETSGSAKDFISTPSR